MKKEEEGRFRCYLYILRYCSFRIGLGSNSSSFFFFFSRFFSSGKNLSSKRKGEVRLRYDRWNVGLIIDVVMYFFLERGLNWRLISFLKEEERERGEEGRVVVQEEIEMRRI